MHHPFRIPRSDFLWTDERRELLEQVRKCPYLPPCNVRPRTRGFPPEWECLAHLSYPQLRNAFVATVLALQDHLNATGGEIDTTLWALLIHIAECQMCTGTEYVVALSRSARQREGQLRQLKPAPCYVPASRAKEHRDSASFLVWDWVFRAYGYQDEMIRVECRRFARAAEDARTAYRRSVLLDALIDEAQ